MGGYDKGESSRLVYLFTRELGLVLAHVQGVREMKSKLRHSLTDFSHTSVDLVLGKGGWRVTNAHGKKNFFLSLDGNDVEYKRGVMVRTTNLLRRLIKGEEKNEKLFDEIINSYNLFDGISYTQEEIFALEIIFVMRILNILGYWGNEPNLINFLEGDISDKKNLESIYVYKGLALREINKALKETQL